MQQKTLLPHSHTVSDFCGGLTLTAFAVNSLEPETWKETMRHLKAHEGENTLDGFFSSLLAMLPVSEQAVVHAVMSMTGREKRKLQALSVPLMIRALQTNDEHERAFLRESIVRSAQIGAQDIIIFDPKTFRRSEGRYAQVMRDLALGNCESFDHPFLAADASDDEKLMAQYVDALAHEGAQQLSFGMHGMRFKCLPCERVIDFGQWYLSPLTRAINTQTHFNAIEVIFDGAMGKQHENQIITRDQIIEMVLSFKELEESVPGVSLIDDEAAFNYRQETGFPPDKYLNEELLIVGEHLERLRTRYGAQISPEIVRQYEERIAQLRERLKASHQIN